MAFTFRQLCYFLAAAENGSVSGAAQVLAISQSAVTEAIRDLEADLGVQLFDRHPRGLDITPRGHQFLRHAQKVMESVSDARQAMVQEGTRLSGKLNIGVTSLVAGYVISDVLARFRRANPAVELAALEDSGEYLEHLLIGGELDVAVMVTSNLRDRLALQAEILDVSPYQLWLPNGHPLASQPSVSIEDLANEPMIMLRLDETEQPTRRLLDAFGAKPKIAFRTRSVEAVRSLVATGAGIAILPALIYRRWSLEGDPIVSRDVSGALPVVQVGVVWRKGAPLSPAVREFIRTAQSQKR
ncbi:LysR family transcriptional regulator [Paracoccus aestuariivivens]|uniref:LysR family transcriptional regulator n=1 Tax=Paracoccus aestuariivivens TaxID=1820333 RepID=A0A6L6J7U6_9RHOB|nr:LysR family transcriptional regulator [Paracoccus aestuariivivens]MTH78020.1 LysR family transcriptional regulator [Paracoccus aestuariivivens]